MSRKLKYFHVPPPQLMQILSHWQHRLKYILNIVYNCKVVRSYLSKIIWNAKDQIILYFFISTHWI